MLTPANTLLDIRKRYQEDLRSDKVTLLIYGDMGVGKTSLLTTARAPILVHGFDPGGLVTVRDEIDSGIIIPDERFAVEDPLNPTAFDLWNRECGRLKRDNIFDAIGTYAIDSATTWAQCAMDVVLKKAGRQGGPPYKQDWLPQMAMLETGIRGLMALPCDVVLIAHSDISKDERTGKMFIAPMLTGKLSIRIPLLFDEIYCAQTEETSKGINYRLLTKPTGLYRARTRLGKKGIFDTYEEPNIKALLRKAGRPCEDREIMSELKS